MAGRLHRHPGLLDWRRPNDLAIAALDALGLGSCGSAIRIYRTAVVRPLRQGWFAHDRATRRDQYSVLRGDGAQDSLVAIQRLPHDFVYAVYIILANSVLRSPLRCLRGHFDAGRGAKPLWPELAVDVRSLFATRWRSGFLIDCLVSEISLNFFVAISGKSSAIAQRRRASG